MPSRMVLGIKPVPDRLIELQRLHPRLALRELQGVAGKIKALLAMGEGYDCSRCGSDPSRAKVKRRGLQPPQRGCLVIEIA